MKGIALAVLPAALALGTGCALLGVGGPAAPARPYADFGLEMGGFLDPGHPRAPLVSFIRGQLADERISNAHWGVLIQSTETGDVWYEQNADRMFIPASNQKVPSAAAALLALGPDFTFTTHLCTTGQVNGGTLDGDLVVFGNGDPTLYERFFDDSRDVFRGWAGTLREMGIERITGDIIGDDNAFVDTHTGAGWPPLTGVTPWYYAEYGPLQINENYVDIMIHPPAAAGEPVELVPNMPSNYYTIVNSLVAVESGSNSVSIHRPAMSNTIYLDGRVVAGSDPFERTSTITNPTLYYVTVLKEVLEEEGIVVEGQPVDCDDLEDWNHKPEDFPVVTVHSSPPFSEIVTLCMKRSQNVYAEILPHVMGWADSGLGSINSGRRVILRELEQFGINENNMNYRDGSGLSRFNYITPRAVAGIYRGMLDTDVSEYWWEAQAVGGVDGTISGRFRDTPGQGNVRGKTGTLGNVRALSGYVTTEGGELLVFSFLVNGHNVSAGQVDSVIDSILLEVIKDGAEEPAEAG